MISCLVGPKSHTGNIRTSGLPKRAICVDRSAMVCRIWAGSAKGGRNILSGSTPQSPERWCAVSWSVESGDGHSAADDGVTTHFDEDRVLESFDEQRLNCFDEGDQVVVANVAGGHQGQSSRRIVQ